MTKRKIAYISGGLGPLSPSQKHNQKVLMSAATPGTQVDIYGGMGSMETRVGEYKEPTERGKGGIFSDYDRDMAIPEYIRKVKDAEKEGYNAVILSCGGDPGQSSMRECVKIPVVGPGASALHVCSMLGNRFTRLVTHRPFRLRKRLLTYEDPFHSGLLKWVSIRSLGMNVFQIRNNPEKEFEALVREGKLAIEEDQCDVITYSCMVTSMHELDERLMEVLKVPVVNPVKAAVRMAELFIDFGLSHSKLSYPTPGTWEYET